MGSIKNSRLLFCSWMVSNQCQTLLPSMLLLAGEDRNLAVASRHSVLADHPCFLLCQCGTSTTVSCAPVENLWFFIPVLCRSKLWETRAVFAVSRTVEWCPQTWAVIWKQCHRGICRASKELQNWLGKALWIIKWSAQAVAELLSAAALGGLELALTCLLCFVKWFTPDLENLMKVVNAEFPCVSSELGEYLEEYSTVNLWGF